MNTRGAVSTKLDQALLVYVGSRLDLGEVKELAGALDGVVLSGRSAYGRATRLREMDYEGPLMMDEATYVDEEPAAEQLAFDVRLDELVLQRNLGAARILVPTAEYFGGGDEQAIIRAIAGASTRCSDSDPERYAIVLALDSSWLVQHSAGLLRSLRTSSYPLALALGDKNDPLSRKGAIETLADVVAELPHTSLLRSDWGAVGALALGASLGAVGITTTHRHAVRPGDFAGGRRRDPSLRVIHPDALSFYSGEFLERLRHIEEGCNCSTCQGQPLSRFHDAALRLEANRHNVAIWRRVVDEVLWERPEHRASTWVGMCRKAVAFEEEFAAKAKTDALQVDAQIRNWSQLKL